MIYKRIIFLLIISLVINNIQAQKNEIGIDYGHANFIYKTQDYGSGFINHSPGNYGPTMSFIYRRNQNPRFYLETGVKFTIYSQYYSTRKYVAAWEQNYFVGKIPLLFGIHSKKRFGYDVNGGLIIGIMPDQYEAEYEAVFVYPYFDSITRGMEYRNFTPLFPMLNFNAGLYYRITNRFTAELKAGYGKGFIKITEFDAYYNNGSGSNDQHARQWGYGDFTSFSLRLRYVLKDKSKYDR